MAIIGEEVEVTWQLPQELDIPGGCDVAAQDHMLACCNQSCGPCILWLPSFVCIGLCGNIPQLP